MRDTHYDAPLVCAYLLRQGYVRKAEFPNLELDEQLLKDVQERLAQIGMELVYNAYSSYYAVRFTRNVQDTIEESNNIGLKNNEVAMLVILWSKLILPKRLALESPSSIPQSVKSNVETPQESSNDPLSAKNDSLLTKLEQPLPVLQTVPETGETNIQAGDANPSPEKAQEKPETADIPKETAQPKNSEDTSSPKQEPEKLFLRMNELYAEFGEHFGSKTAFKSTLTRLSNLQFIHIHNEIITEGIFLDLLIDGQQMGNEIKRSALSYKLAGLAEEEELEEDSPETADSSEEEESVVQYTVLQNPQPVSKTEEQEETGKELQTEEEKTE